MLYFLDIMSYQLELSSINTNAQIASLLFLVQVELKEVAIKDKKPSWTLGVADRTAPSHTSTITRYAFERSTRSVDKKIVIPTGIGLAAVLAVGQLADWLNCASVYTVNCELCTANAQRPVPTAGHAHALWSRGPLHSSQIVNNISDVGFFTQVMQTNNP